MSWSPALKDLVEDLTGQGLLGQATVWDPADTIMPKLLVVEGLATSRLSLPGGPGGVTPFPPLGTGTTGQVLTIMPDGSLGWTTPPTVGGGSTPTGPAGGSLTGSYPNPLIANDAVLAAMLAPAVRAQLVPVPVFTADQGKVLTVEPGTGVIRWMTNGATPIGAAGGDLMGTYPNPQIRDQAVGWTKIAPSSVDNSQLQDGSVSRQKCQTDMWLNPIPSAGQVGRVLTVVPGPSLAWQAPSALISGPAGGELTGTYPDPQIRDNVITWTKMADNAIGTAELQDGAVGRAKCKLELWLNPIPTVADVGKTLMVMPGPALMYASPSAIPGGPAGGDLTGIYPDPHIANGVVTRVKTAPDLWLVPIPTAADINKRLIVDGGPEPFLAWSAETEIAWERDAHNNLIPADPMVGGIQLTKQTDGYLGLAQGNSVGPAVQYFEAYIAADSTGLTIQGGGGLDTPTGGAGPGDETFWLGNQNEYYMTGTWGGCVVFPPLLAGDLERVTVAGGIQLTTALQDNEGTIQYTGGHFQGRRASGWVNLDDAGGGGGDTLWTDTGTELAPVEMRGIALADMRKISAPAQFVIGTAPNDNLTFFADHTSVAGGLRLWFGPTVPTMAGMLQWDGSHFLGFNGSAWVQLDNDGGGGAPPGGYWTVDDVNGIYSSRDAGETPYNVQVAGGGLLFRTGTAVNSSTSLWMNGNDFNIRSIGRINFVTLAGLSAKLDDWGSLVLPTLPTPTENERLTVAGGISLGTATAAVPADGTLQWNGTNFQGRVGGAWVNLATGGASLWTDDATAKMLKTVPLDRGISLASFQTIQFNADGETNAGSIAAAGLALQFLGGMNGFQFRTQNGSLIHTAVDGTKGVWRFGSRTIKSRIFSATNNDYTFVTHNAALNNAETAWVEDDITKTAWVERFATAEDNWSINRISTGGTTLAPMLVCDPSGFLTATGGFIAPGVNTVSQLAVGPGTYKGRFRVYQHALTIGVNRTDADTQDDNSRPSWYETFDLSNDMWSLSRRAAGGGATILLSQTPTKLISGVDVDLFNVLTLMAGSRKVRVTGSNLGGAYLTVNTDQAGTPDRTDMPSWAWVMDASSPTGTTTLRRRAENAGAGVFTNLLTIDPTGKVTIGADPTAALDVATKQYVDGKFAGGGNGSLGTQNYITASATITSTQLDNIVTANAAAIDVTLPAWNTVLGGQTFRFTRTDGQTTRTVRIVAGAGDNIDGATSYNLPTGASVTIMALTTITSARRWVTLATQLWKTTDLPNIITPVDGFKRLVIVGPSTSETSDQSQFVFGTRTVKGRQMALPGFDSLYLTTNARFNNTTWAFDDSSKASWLFGLDVAGDKASWFRGAPGAQPVELLQLDSTGVLKLPGDATSATCSIGSQTAKTRLIAHNTVVWGAFSVNTNTVLGTQDDAAKPSWEVLLRADTDVCQIRRRAAGGTLSVPLSINGGGTITTLAGVVCAGNLNFGPSGIAEASPSAVGIDFNYAWGPPDLTKCSWTMQLEESTQTCYWYFRARSASAGTVTSVMQVSGAGNLAISGPTATKSTGTTWGNPSDRRLKDDIEDYSTGLPAVLRLQPRTFVFNGKGGSQAGARGYGFIADEVMGVMDEMVGATMVKLDPADEEQTEISTLDQSNLILALVNSVKELAARVVALEVKNV